VAVAQHADDQGSPSLGDPGNYNDSSASSPLMLLKAPQQVRQMACRLDR
jgi:hypothetical protein